MACTQSTKIAPFDRSAPEPISKLLLGVDRPYMSNDSAERFAMAMIEAKPENLIGDRAYDSDPLDEELHQHGIEMIAPHRSRSKPPTQDRGRLSRYMRRWLVERFFAWLQWQAAHPRPL
jgi:transposase